MEEKSLGWRRDPQGGGQVPKMEKSLGWRGGSRMERSPEWRRDAQNGGEVPRVEEMSLGG